MAKSGESRRCTHFSGLSNDNRHHKQPASRITCEKGDLSEAVNSFSFARHRGSTAIVAGFLTRWAADTTNLGADSTGF
jgi:hypothetical protein